MTTADVTSLLPPAAALDREWYHTIELGSGMVTPGWFDTRGIAQELPMPKSLTGLRCLDVATFDGFWAFEMERRGASEVLAIDVLDPHRWDWPADRSDNVVAALAQRKEGGRGFTVASRALASSVAFQEMSVYDLAPEMVGEFDFVYVGSLLLHLRDPVGALSQVRRVTRGQLLLVDNINWGLSLVPRPIATLDGRGRPWWWRLNLAGLVRVVEAAGFQLVRPPHRFNMPVGRGHPRPRPTLELLRSAEGRETLLRSVRGDPHAALLVEPISPPGSPS